MLEVLNSENNLRPLKKPLKIFFAAKGLEPRPSNLIPVEKHIRQAPLPQGTVKGLYRKVFTVNNQRKNLNNVKKGKAATSKKRRL